MWLRSWKQKQYLSEKIGGREKYFAYQNFVNNYTFVINQSLTRFIKCIGVDKKIWFM